MKPEYMVPGGPCAYCGGNHCEWDCKASEGRDGKSTDRLFRVTGLLIGVAIVLYILYFWHPLDILGVRP